MFDVEASLWPGHPNYELPRAGEWTCYKPAMLVFDGVRSDNGLSNATTVPACLDADGSRDFGTIDELVAGPGGFRITGDFGVVLVQADSVRLEVGIRAEVAR